MNDCIYLLKRQPESPGLSCLHFRRKKFTTLKMQFTAPLLLQ